MDEKNLEKNTTPQETLNQSEDLKTPEQTETNQEQLELEGHKFKDEVLNRYQRGFKALKDLAKSVINYISPADSRLQPIKKQEQDLEKEALELEATTENKIDRISGAIAEKPNFDTSLEAYENTTLSEAGPKQQERFDTKIRPEMKEAIATICGGAFNKACKLPYCLIGSNCYVPNAETKKITDDLDVVFDINDFEAVQNELEKMTKEGLVYRKEKNKDTGEETMVAGYETKALNNWEGKPNGCKKIHTFIKATNEKGETTYVEMEAFGQNGDKNVKNDKGETLRNGIININLDKLQVDRYQVNGVEALIGSREVAEDLYRANARNEAGLLDANGHKIKNFLTFKYLQRRLNLETITRDKYDSDKQPSDEEIEEEIISGMEGAGYRTPVAEYGTKLVRDSWENFKQEKEYNTPVAEYGKKVAKESWENYKSEVKTGKGLVNTVLNEIIEEKGLKITPDEYKANDKFYKEDVVEKMTKMVQKDLETLNVSHELKEKCTAMWDNVSPDAAKEMAENLDKFLTDAKAMFRKYKAYEGCISNQDEQSKFSGTDFCISPAVTGLNKYFLLPTLRTILKERRALIHYEIDLKNKNKANK